MLTLFELKHKPGLTELVRCGLPKILFENNKC